MRKRLIKNSVRYIDSHLAIVDWGGSAQNASDITRLLLKVGTNQVDKMAPIRELLERQPLYFLHHATIPGVRIHDLDDPECVKSLGYKLSEFEGDKTLPLDYEEPIAKYDWRLCRLNVYPSQDSDSPFSANAADSLEGKRFCVDVRSVLEAADAVQYVARLALLALGDTRAADGIRLLESGDSSEHILMFDALVPLGILDEPEYAAERLEQIFPGGVEVCEFYKDEQRVRLRCSGYPSNYYGRDSLRPFPDGEVERKMIAANILLSALLNLSMQFPYRPDADSGLPEKQVTANLLTLVVDFARDGKLSGCPHCGWPVLMPTPKSDPYCRKSHRTRTDEKKVN